MIWEVLTSLGLGEQLLAAAVLVLVAFYALRFLSTASTIGGLLSAGVMYLVVAAVLLAAALALGWVDPEPDVVMQTIASLKDALVDMPVDFIRSTLEGVV